MNAKVQVKNQARTPVAPAAARIPQPPVAEPEHEAERPNMAAQLEGAARLGHSFGTLGVDHSPPPTIQRQESPEEEEEELQLKRESAAVQRQEIPEEEEEELMMKPEEGRVGPQGGPVPPEVEAAIRRARGGGQPLEGALQEQMSASLGHDFSEVRVHTDAEADALNRQLSAKAFTTGREIFFRQGEYNPGSDSGRELIGHELTHVVQQTTGRVRGDQRGMAVRPSGDAFEHEAEDAARQRRGRQDKSKGDETRELAWPDMASPTDIFALQRTVGSRAVRRLLRQVEVDFQPVVDTKALGTSPFDTRKAKAAVVTEKMDPSPASVAALDDSTWGYTEDEEVRPTITVTRDRMNGNWQTILKRLTGMYSLQARLLPAGAGSTTGVAEVTGPGGNTGDNNWERQLEDLKALGETADPSWYMLKAVQEHERVHELSLRSALKDVSDDIEKEYKELTVPLDNHADMTSAANAIRGLPGYGEATTHARQKWDKKYTENIDRDHVHETRVAEHKVVDPMITKIRRVAKARGWPGA